MWHSIVFWSEVFLFGNDSKDLKVFKLFTVTRTKMAFETQNTYNMKRQATRDFTLKVVITRHTKISYKIKYFKWLHKVGCLDTDTKLHDKFIGNVAAIKCLGGLVVKILCFNGGSNPSLSLSGLKLYRQDQGEHHTPRPPRHLIAVIVRYNFLRFISIFCEEKVPKNKLAI